MTIFNKRLPHRDENKNKRNDAYLSLEILCLS